MDHASSVTMQKGKSQNRSNKKTKHTEFSEKRTFLTPCYVNLTIAYQGVRNVSFRKNWLALFSYYPRFEIHFFALLPTSYCLHIEDNH